MMRWRGWRVLGCLGLGVSTAACGGGDSGSSGAGANGGGPAGAGASGPGAGGTSPGGMGPGGDGGGAGGCGDTTSDPMNCGSCGNVCVSGLCVASACQPGFVGCFDASPGDTCQAFCASMDGDCVAQGCEGINQGLTFRTFDFEDSCINTMSIGGEFNESCTTPILDVANGDRTECCCR